MQISVWEIPELNVRIPVRPDGNISLPVLGDIAAAGLTPDQLAQYIRNELIACNIRQDLKDLRVAILVAEANSFKVRIEGEISRPGSYTFRRPTTLLELLADAGGVRDKADLQNSYLLRNNQKQSIDFYRLLNKGETNQNIYLAPGDLIFIAHNFENRLTILGEVRSPQVVSYTPGLTILDVILTAGGPLEGNYHRSVEILRREEGKRRSFSFNLDTVLKAVETSQYTNLAPGDVIIIGGVNP